MKMEEERERDIRVPLISFILCLLVLTGGVFLVLYVFIPNLSQPWFPIVAFLLIGSPWIFWLFCYIYTCFKPYFRCRHSRLEKCQPSQRSHHGPPPAALPELTKKPSMEESPVNTSSGGRRVQFGGVVVIDGEKGEEQSGGLEGRKEEGELGVASSNDSVR